MQDNNFRNIQAKDRNEILVLPSWYPNKLDVFAGDFVKRHVEAISLLHAQCVIFVMKDEHAVLTNEVLKTKNTFGNYTEIIIYYHIKKTGVRVIDKLRSDRKYLQLYKNAITDYIRLEGIPKLCHVHIAVKAGLAAIWLKNKYKVPFIVTEHWSGYLAEAIPHVSSHGLIFQKRTNRIFDNADAVTAVSNYLASGIKNLFPKLNPIVIPNVVDTKLFYPLEKSRKETTGFIHASTMNYPKNMEKILEALQILKFQGYNFNMDLFGPAQPVIFEMIKAMSLTDLVFLKGEVSQAELAHEMQRADALIQFSRFETFGCVVIEANAVGLPVFISDIPALLELIGDNQNGFVVKADDAVALADKLMAFIDGKLPLQIASITANTASFSYLTVAQQFSKVYCDII